MGSFLFTLAIGTLIGAAFLWFTMRGQEHSDTPKAASDLVNWDYIEQPETEGIIRLQDGGVLASYRYKGADLSSAGEGQRAQLSELLNRFFREYENGFGFYFSMMRDRASGYPNGDTFPDPVTFSIDQERRAKHNGEGQHYRSLFYLSVVWKPTYRAEVEDFLEVLEQLESKLDRILYPQRLKADEHLSLLYRQMHGIDQPITPPAAAEPINGLLANQEIQVLPFYEQRKHPVKSKLGIASENVLIDGDHYIRTITISGFPNQTHNGILNRLNQLRSEYRWTTRVFTIDRETQEKKIKDARNKFRMGRKDGTDIFTGSMSSGKNQDSDVSEAYKNLDAVSKMKDSSVALSKIADRNTAFCVCTSTITLIDENYEGLKDSTGQVLSCLREAGFTGTIEKFQSLRAWKGSLPGHADNIRREFISTYNLSDILPTWSMWTGREENPSQYMKGADAHFQAKTVGNEPFKKHRPAHGDLGHSMIIGKSGGGKSTYVNFENAQWRRHPNGQIFLFDVGYTGQLLCEAAGGQHYDLFNNESIGFQPLRGLTKQTLSEGFYSQWVEDLFRLQGVQVTPTDKKRISLALQKVAEEPEEARTLSQFMFQLQDPHLKDAIKIYTRDGKYEGILDSANDSITQNNYQVFELSNLLNQNEQIVLPVLMYLFYRVRKALRADRPTLIYIEEAWAAFKNEHFQERLKEWLLTLRKYNGHVALVTHSPEQIHQLKNPDIFVGNTPERVFLPNPDILQPEVKKHYSIFGLSESQLQTIKDLTPKKEYYIQTPHGSGAIDLELLPLSLAFIADPSGLSVSQRQEKITELKDEYGPQWPVAWLRYCDMPDQAKRLKKNINLYNQSQMEVA